MSFVAYSFKDACEFLVCYLVRAAYNMSANSVRPADQVVPLGSDGNEFATVKILSSDADFGTSNKSHVNDTTQGSTKLVETLDNRYTFTTSIQFFRHATPVNDSAGLAKFGLGAFDKAARLVTRLGAEDMLELTESMNLGIEESSPARNVSALVNGAYYEDRGSVDVTFTIPNSETILINSLATASVLLKLAQPGRARPDTATITAEVTT